MIEFAALCLIALIVLYGLWKFSGSLDALLD